MNRERGSTILRTLQLLEAIAQSERPQTVTELTESLDIPKATAHRLCTTLEQEGFLQRRLDGRRVMPGERFHRLATSVLAHSTFSARRHAILHQLSVDIGETCNISVPESTGMVYFDRVETHWPLRLQLPIGTRVPLHCTAAGKLYLSSLPLRRCKRLIESLNLEPHTPNTITQADALLENLKEIRHSSVGIDNQEFSDGMLAFSAPIKDQTDRLYATVSFHAPIVRMTLEDGYQHVPRLQRAARELTALLDEPVEQ